MWPYCGHIQLNRNLLMLDGLGYCIIHFAFASQKIVNSNFKIKCEKQKFEEIQVKTCISFSDHISPPICVKGSPNDIF